MAAMIAPSRGTALSRALPSSPAAMATTLPGFLLPAWQTPSAQHRQRQFSTTTKRPSKLGRTPISVPPGVELLMSEPKSTRSATSFQPLVKKTITVKGPLGWFLPCSFFHARSSALSFEGS